MFDVQKLLGPRPNWPYRFSGLYLVPSCLIGPAHEADDVVYGQCGKTWTQSWHTRKAGSTKTEINSCIAKLQR